MTRRSLLKGGLWVTAGGVLSALSSFLRNVVIARFISVEDFGIASLLALTMSIVEMASNLAVNRLIVQAPDGDAPRFQGTAQAFQALRGVVSGAVLLTAAPLVSDFFRVPHAAFAFQLLALVPVVRGFMHLDVVRYQRQMQFACSTWVEALPQVLIAAVAIPLSMWLRDFTVMAWLIIGQALMQTVLSFILAERAYRWNWDRATVGKIYGFGWPLLVNGLLMFLIFQGDKAIIGRYFSMEILGWYSAAFMLSLSPAMLTTQVAQSLLLPTLSKIETDSDGFGRRYALAIQVCLFAGTLFAVGFATIGPELLILLFGEHYRDGLVVMALFGIMQGVRIAKAGPLIVAMSRGETKNPMLSNLVRGFSFLFAILAVQTGYGVTSVALLSLVGEILAFGVSLWLLYIRLALPVRQFMVPVTVCAFIVIAIWALDNLCRQHVGIVGQLCLAVAATLGGAFASLSAMAELRDGFKKIRI